jgi:hypothetical protein
MLGAATAPVTLTVRCEPAGTAIAGGRGAVGQHGERAVAQAGVAFQPAIGRRRAGQVQRAQAPCRQADRRQPDRDQQQQMQPAGQQLRQVEQGRADEQAEQAERGPQRRPDPLEQQHRARHAAPAPQRAAEAFGAFLVSIRHDHALAP